MKMEYCNKYEWPRLISNLSSASSRIPIWELALVRCFCYQCWQQPRKLLPFNHQSWLVYASQLWQFLPAMLRRVRKKKLFLKTIISETRYMCEYLRCWISQKWFISEVLVILKRSLLLNLKDQSTSSTGIDLSFLLLGAFFLKNPSFTMCLKRPHHTDSNFCISLALNCHAWTEYNKRLRTQASRNFILVERNIRLSRITDFNSFHLE